MLIELDCIDHNGKQEVAKLFYNPWSSAGAKRIYEQQFVNRFINGWTWRKKIAALPSAQAVAGAKACFDVPQMITHRINDKGHSVVHGIKFRTRTTMGGKDVDHKEA